MFKRGQKVRAIKSNDLLVVGHIYTVLVSAGGFTSVKEIEKTFIYNDNFEAVVDTPACTEENIISTLSVAGINFIATKKGDEFILYKWTSLQNTIIDTCTDYDTRYRDIKDWICANMKLKP